MLTDLWERKKGRKGVSENLTGKHSRKQRPAVVRR